METKNEKVIIHASPDDFILAVRAVKSAIEKCQHHTIIQFDNGKNFLVMKNKKSWSVWGEG